MNPLAVILSEKTVLVVGCGGLGCNVVEYLARAKTKRIIIIDPDVFQPSNLNRQLYCNEKTMGRFKAEVAGEHIANISNSEPVIITKKFPTDELDRYNSEIDIVVDCMDNVEGRIKLEEYASAINVPLIHGAINGTVGQITTVMPGDGVLAKLYSNNAAVITETMAYVPSLIASLQVAEIIKVLNNKPSLRGTLLLIDLVNTSFTKVKL